MNRSALGGVPPWLPAILWLLLLGGCAAPVMQQSIGHVRPDDTQSRDAGSIPPITQVVPVLPKPTPTVRPEVYSVVVNNVRVQDLLFALARDARVNIDIHPDVEGTVTLNAIDQTLPQLLSRLSRQVDMRYEMLGDTLLVRRDLPFVRIYRVDYLNIARNVKTGVSTTTGISSGGAGSGGASSGSAGASGASQGGTTITIESQNRFWQVLQQNVRDLVIEEDKLRTLSQRTTQVVAQGTGQASAGGTTPGGAAAGASGAGATAAAGQGAVSGAGNQQVAGATQMQQAELATHVFANPDAGILMVRTTTRVHEKVQEYLDAVLSRSKHQVMIEATIAEVSLNNNYQQGIDWSILRRGNFGLNLIQSVTGTSPAAVNSSLFVADYASSRFNATIRLLESFGTVRVLSSPKVSVLNNQTAVLRVTDNRVYFTVQATTTATANVAATTTFTTTPHTVDIGFTMNVTPQISDASTVVLNVRPVVSRIVGFVTDPNPDLARAGVVSRIPEVQVRDIESMIRIGDGQIAVMGGLIQDSVSDTEDGLPGLNRIQDLGSIFTHRNRENRKTELVIFIRPVVIRDASIDGDFRALRDLMPGADFLQRPNPGKEVIQPGLPPQR